MAEATLVLTRLLPLIEKKVREEVNLLLNADNQVLSLSQKLKKILEVLADAEQWLVKDPRVQSWIQKLQDISYEIEDALEEWEVQNINHQLHEDEEHSESSTSDSWDKKVCSFLESVCSCFKQTVERRAIALDVQQMHQRLDSLAQENENEFKFIPNLGYDSQSENHQRIITKSFVDETKVKGRDHDKDVVMSMLLSESSSQVESGVKIVSIVGAGGMGKTTLAQIIFKDKRVDENFDVKIWVCVSDPFEEIRVYKAILEVIDKGSSSLSEPDALLQAIEKSISLKRFFLVLDDVWTESDTDTWDPLKASLKEGAPKSSILVTTRKEIVANLVGSDCTHLLKELNDTDCWSLLSQIAFHNKKESDRVMLSPLVWRLLRNAKACRWLQKLLEVYCVSKEVWGSGRVFWRAKCGSWRK